jgi:hypothetical protein
VEEDLFDRAVLSLDRLEGTRLVHVDVQASINEVTTTPDGFVTFNFWASLVESGDTTLSLTAH